MLPIKPCSKGYMLVKLSDRRHELQHLILYLEVSFESYLINIEQIMLQPDKKIVRGHTI